MKIKPKKLNKGDTIGIISPAGNIKDETMLQNAVKYFKEQGFKVKTGKNALNQNEYLAGTDRERLSDLIEFFKDDEINAIICARGGYGTFRLLESIDFEIIKNNPKIFVGYSDITALLNNFYEKSGLICFHGPLAVSDFGCPEQDEFTINNFFKILQGNINLPHKFERPTNYSCINPGITEGELLGGNFAIMCGLLGTPYFPDLKGKILFLEDVDEPLYKIDRMLSQLKLAGVFNKISGLVFGNFSYTNSSSKENTDNKIIKIIKKVIKDTKIPIGYGFPIGHDKPKHTLPLGVKYGFDSEGGLLELREKFLEESTVI